MAADIPIIEAPEMEQQQAGAESVYNEGLMRSAALGAMCIQDRDLTAPPGGESDGEIWIPAATATGAWATHEDDIAVYYNGYIFITPIAGMKAYVDDEEIWIGYDGTEWHPLQRTWSTTEYFTGEYFGGEKVYAKTIDVGTLPDSTSSTDAHGVSPVTIVRVIGMADNGTNQIPMPNVSSTLGVEIYVDDTNINIVTTSTMSGYSGMVTLEYTKT